MYVGIYLNVNQEDVTSWKRVKLNEQCFYTYIVVGTNVLLLAYLPVNIHILLSHSVDDDLSFSPVPRFRAC